LSFFDRVVKDIADNYVITNGREASLQLIQYATDSGYQKIADPSIDIPEQMIVPSKLSICETCKKG